MKTRRKRRRTTRQPVSRETLRELAHVRAMAKALGVSVEQMVTTGAAREQARWGRSA